MTFTKIAILCNFCVHVCGVTDIPIGVLILSNAGTPYDIERVGPAIDLAIEKVNKEILNKDYKLRKVERKYDNMCSNAKAPGVLADMFQKENIAALIGPACAYALDPVAKMANYWNIPIVTGLGDGGNFKNKTNFPTLTRFAYCQCRLRKVLGSVFNEFNWKSIAIIYDINDVHSNVLGLTLQTGLQKQKIFPRMFPFYGNQNPDYQNLLYKVNAVSRVILLIVPGEELRHILLKAYDLGYITNGEFVFFDILLFTFPGEYWGNHDWSRGDSRDAEAKKAFEAVLRVSLQVPESMEWVNFTTEIKQSALVNYGFDFETEEINFFVGAFHDAVVLYGIALNETIQEEKDYRDGYNVTRKMWNRTFHGVTEDVLIDDNGDRDTSYSILDMDPVSGKFHVVANYWGQSPGYTPVAGRSIHWAGGRTTPPTNVPYCGYLGELDICKQNIPNENNTVTIILLMAMTFLLIIVGIITIFVYKKYKAENDLQNMVWRVNYNDIEILSTDHSKSFCSLLSAERSMKSCVTIKTMKSRKHSFYSTETHTVAPLALYKGERVIVKWSEKEKIDLTRDVLMELKQVRGLHHDNLVRFIGACVEYKKNCMLMEYCSKGTLEDVINNDNINLDWTFKISLMKDIAKGMVYIHGSEIKHHGRLSSWNCVVDSRFVVKIKGYGLHTFRDIKENSTTFYYKQLWSAPEHLRSPNEHSHPKGDVYSFAIIMEEVFTRGQPFESYAAILNAEDIVQRVKNTENPPFRPKIDKDNCSENIYVLMQRCWSENVNDRPTMQEILSVLIKEDKFGNKSLMDSLLCRMEQYATNLEEIVEERTQQLIVEKRRSDELLYQILPRPVADKLRMGKKVEPDYYDMVSIYFSDIVGFTKISSKSSPLQIVTMLNDLYTLFDNVIDTYDVYKVETIGDAYMVVSGLPMRNGNQHVVQISKMSFDLLKRINNFVIPHLPLEKLRLRIGIHSGPCVSGVVGRKMPRYCLFGDTVNVASRMESSGEALKIHISDITKKLLDEVKLFHTSSRGIIDVKGKGQMNTFWLVENYKQTPDANITESEHNPELGYKNDGKDIDPTEEHTVIEVLEMHTSVKDNTENKTENNLDLLFEFNTSDI